MRLRYGDVDTGTPHARLRMKQQRNRVRRQTIETQVAELLEEHRRLAEEDSRLEALLQELIGEIVERIRNEEGEGWSPAPITGYRLWEFAPDGLRGATGHVWSTPDLVASCPAARRHDDLPHTDHLCSSIGHGCGIYAVRDPDRLGRLGRPGFLLGRVELSGKVVEHDHGYRAGRARVTAVVAHAASLMLVSDDTCVISSLFERPYPTLREHGTERFGLDHEEALEAMHSLERSKRPWT